MLKRNGDKARFDAAEVDFVEIVSDPSVPDFFVVRADCLTQLEAEWLVIQPDVFRANPMKGWEPIGGSGYNRQVFIGSEELSTINVRSEGPATLCSVSGLGEAGFEIWNLSDGPIDLIATPRQ